MKKYLVLFIMLFLQACAVTPRFNVSVDSISVPDAAAKNKYVLLPGLEEVKPNDLQYKEFATYVDRALASSGYTKVQNSDQADIEIYLGYGIDGPEAQRYLYSSPLHWRTGINTYRVIRTDSGKKIVYFRPSFYWPSYGYGHSLSATYVGTRNTYRRYLWLEAIDLQGESEAEDEVVQLWKTSVASMGFSDDLRQVFPVLVAASKPYIGTNTGKKVKVILSESDESVVEIKGLNSQPQP